MKRVSLQALAKSRGPYYTHVRWRWHLTRHGRARLWLGSVFLDWNSDVSLIGIEAPTRRACEAGLRAALEALPVRKGRAK